MDHSPQARGGGGGNRRGTTALGHPRACTHAHAHVHGGAQGEGGWEGEAGWEGEVHQETQAIAETGQRQHGEMGTDARVSEEPQEMCLVLAQKRV